MVEKMTKKQLIKNLQELHGKVDEEIAHGTADDLLLEYINDKEVKKAFNLIDKWYA